MADLISLKIVSKLDVLGVFFGVLTFGQENHDYQLILVADREDPLISLDDLIFAPQLPFSSKCSHTVGDDPHLYQRCECVRECSQCPADLQNNFLTLTSWEKKTKV